MKVFILGSKGMAGHVITRYLTEKNYDVYTSARSGADFYLDVENIQSIDKICEIILEEVKPDFVINCIGLLVHDSNTRPDRAALINSWFPHYIEHKLKDSITKLIHLSTDCVFDGKKGNYLEEDTHTENNFYGRSKSLGEVNNQKDITLRMSIIGPELKETGSGLFNFIFKNSDSNINGWENAWWNGITTLQLAKCIEIYMKNPKISGIYHLVSNRNKINKYELLCKINEIYNLGKTITKTSGPKDINKILIDTRQEIDFKIPDYHTQLVEMKDYV